MQKKIIYLVMFSLFLGMLTTNVNARESTSIEVKENEILPDYVKLNDVKRGSLLFQTDLMNQYHQALILSTDVDIKVTGMIARVTLRQTFKNMEKKWLEGVYVFPLPENSAVNKMKIKIGERIIKAEIKERREAKKIYRDAKILGKKAALIEQERPNLFTNNIANIGPEETVIVEIEYQQIIDIENNEFNLRFPMAITPRYIPTERVIIKEKVEAFNSQGWSTHIMTVKDASRITPPVLEENEKINPVTITIDLMSGFPLGKINSLYHKIKVNRLEEAKIKIQLEDGAIVSDRDFVLVWEAKTGKEPKAALFSEKFEGNIYHLLMIMPPKPISLTNLMAREVIFIIDTSGSMDGVSMIQAKNALKLAIKRLASHDKFNVISFNSTTDVLFTHARLASNENVQLAMQYTEKLSSGGGTEMKEALEAALSQQHATQPLRQVIFLTDGSVGNEKELFQYIKDNVGDSRLFTVGIGSAPNSYFMRKSADFGRGSFTYIADVNEVQNKMSILFKKLEMASMTNIKIDFGSDGTEHETYPQRIPDLYFGEPLIITTKTKDANHIVTLQGDRGNQQWINSVDLSQTSSNQSSGIATLWARGKITSLMDTVHDGKTEKEIRLSVIDVALKHHLVSKYTSLVAVEERMDRSSDEFLKTKAIPVNLPHGQKHSKIFGSLAQTATSVPLNFAIGLSLFFIAIIVLLQTKRRIVDEV